MSGGQDSAAPEAGLALGRESFRGGRGDVRFVVGAGPSLHGYRFTSLTAEDEEERRQRRAQRAAAARAARRDEDGPGSRVAAVASVRSAGTGRRRAARVTGRGFTGASKRAYMKSLGCSDFTPLVGAGVVMVTLTYPDECLSGDDRVNKRHLRMFLDRWEYRWGKPAGTWVLEFQPERGAAHFHLYLPMPADVRMTGLSGWCKDKWAAVIGAPDATRQLWHRRDLGVLVRRMPAFEPMRAAGYFWAHNAKFFQKAVPDGYKNLGRVWSVFGLERVVHETDVCADAGVQYRRVVRRQVEKRLGRKMRQKYKGMMGAWSLGGDGIGTSVALVRLVRGLCGWDGVAGRRVRPPCELCGGWL